MAHSQHNKEFCFRGEGMTRIETFVAAAFAFALSMLVISLDEIPGSIEEFVAAAKNIPSFIASCALILWIWFCHADWSRRYGLEDGKTIFLSGALICIVLIYMYPLRLMMQGLFMNISGGFFPFQMAINEFWELRFLFTFYAVGFTLLSLTFMALFKHAHSLSEKLSLTEYELFHTKGALIHWSVSLAISFIVVTITLFVPNKWLMYSPYLYVMLWPAHHITQMRQDKLWREIAK